MPERHVINFFPCRAAQQSFPFHGVVFLFTDAETGKDTIKVVFAELFMPQLSDSSLRMRYQDAQGTNPGFGLLP